MAFPGVGTSIYNYPKLEAAAIAGHEIRQWLGPHAPPAKVIFVVFDYENRWLYEQALVVRSDTLVPPSCCGLAWATLEAPGRG